MSEVTVLLPVFNGEEYLRETMHSILKQTYLNFEFLIIDDGSTDNSPEIINSFQDSRIRLLKNPTRLKLSGALNRGIEEARGKYIARMDADDIAFPNRLAAQVEFLDSHPEIGMCGTAIEIFGKEPERIDIYPKATEDIRSYGLFDCPFCHPSVMFRKELFNKFNLRYNGEYYPTEDYELWSRVIELFPTANLGQVLLRYRIHDKSMTGADWDEMDKKATDVIRPLLTEFHMEFTEEQLQLHRNIGRGRSCKLKNLQELHQAELWLAKLLKCNGTKELYNQESLAQVVSLVWFRLCVNSSSLGTRVLTRYLGSGLAGNHRSLKDLCIVFGSIMKNSLLQKSVNG